VPSGKRKGRRGIGKKDNRKGGYGVTKIVALPKGGPAQTCRESEEKATEREYLMRVDHVLKRKRKPLRKREEMAKMVMNAGDEGTSFEKKRLLLQERKRP